MSADHELNFAYREWRRLAEAEGEAIRAGDWILVSDCQNAMRRLQQQIIQCSEQARQEWASQHLDRTEKENSLRALIKPLIELEWRNHTLLDIRRCSVQSQLGQLNEARQTLRRLRQSCVRTPAATLSLVS